MTMKRLWLGLLLSLHVALVGLAQTTPTNFLKANPHAGTKKMNVFVLLSKNLEEYAMTVSKALKDQEGLDSFALQGYQIHCTLYMTNYDDKNVEQVKERVASFVAGVHPFVQKTSGLVCTKDNWLFINFEKNRNLQILSDGLVQALSPLRAENQPVPSWLASYPEKLEYFKQYGSPNVFQQFEPHITLLSRSDGEKVNRFAGKASADEKLGGMREGQVIGVGIAIADGAGQMKERLATFLFK